MTMTDTWENEGGLVTPEQGPCTACTGRGTAHWFHPLYRTFVPVFCSCPTGRRAYREALERQAARRRKESCDE